RVIHKKPTFWAETGVVIHNPQPRASFPPLAEIGLRGAVPGAQGGHRGRGGGPLRRPARERRGRSAGPLPPPSGSSSPRSTRLVSPRSRFVARRPLPPPGPRAAPRDAERVAAGRFRFEVPSPPVR